MVNHFSTPVAFAWVLIVSLLLIGAFDTPDRLPQDVSVDHAKPLIKDRLITPLAGDDADQGRYPLPEKSPRRG